MHVLLLECVRPVERHLEERMGVRGIKKSLQLYLTLGKQKVTRRPEKANLERLAMHIVDEPIQMPINIE